MHLVGSHPASGFRLSESETSRRQVKVVFVGGEQEAKVSARWSNGRLVCSGGDRPTPVGGSNLGD